jgi:hypothetical protein
MTEEDKNYEQQQYNALNYSNEQFDKSVIFIASGALGISFAFIEKVIPDIENALCSNLLIISWSIFAGVIFISLVAHFISMCAIRWSINNYQKSNYENGRRNRNIIIRTINVFMIIGILAGLGTLIYFVKSNI